MKPWTITILTLCGVMMLASPVLADWKPDDGHKMHFPQLPDEDGWDVNATYPKVLADDWQCSGTGWVRDIHWWGSWEYGQEGTIRSFLLSIHRNNPGPPSTPADPPLWEAEVPFSMIQVAPRDPPTMQGWYDPNTGLFRHPDHSNYFQYNLTLPETHWFWQDKGQIYWLNISAMVVEPDLRWGWKSSEDHFMDDAVVGHLLSDATTWTPLYEPPEFTQTLDLAFVITPEPASLTLLALGGLALLRRRR